MIHFVHYREWALISSPDVVLAVRGQKKQGRGKGKGEEETRSGKIRLRGPESASTAHALNLTCFHVYSTDIEFDTALSFVLKNAVL